MLGGFVDSVFFVFVVGCCGFDSFFWDFSMETVSGFLDFSICSGVKDGGAAGLRCRFPLVLVLFSFPPLNP